VGGREILRDPSSTKSLERYSILRENTVTPRQTNLWPTGVDGPQIKTTTRSKTTVAAMANVTNANPAASRTSSMLRSMHTPCPIRHCRNYVVTMSFWEHRWSCAKFLSDVRERSFSAMTCVPENHCISKGARLRYEQANGSIVCAGRASAVLPQKGSNSIALTQIGE
jgi:hypothetical protein